MNCRSWADLQPIYPIFDNQPIHNPDCLFVIFAVGIILLPIIKNILFYKDSIKKSN
tara:strand:- start:420 stop:587 length:168 start_codon:yes stop_codon:yes gene_type:complete